MSDKKKSFLQKVILPIVLVILVLVNCFLAVRSIFDDRASFARIERFWNDNRETLEQFAEGKISEKRLRACWDAVIIKDITVETYDNPQQGNIIFGCGGSGISIGPSTYVGFVYTISGQPDPMSWGRPDWETTDDQIYTIEGKRYKLVVTRLDEHWFLYEEHMD